MARLTASSHHMKVLTEAVTDFIVRDMCPINTVDGEGFINLQNDTILYRVGKLSV